MKQSQFQNTNNYYFGLFPFYLNQYAYLIFLFPTLTMYPPFKVATVLIDVSLSVITSS